ncbi:ArsR/SmtB family transcription factor [Conexibacter woesei]|uniref:Transcriptional regulator, ArsR family n=1 Tax=Conexibacter woesei (strain DSM 14684 / CCUG 47730 / CIP 108061 / JCM 11494 / NBRC 100937 / ID131577) TaxID=469383 RepID=D3FCA0_CONWI|nr:metalloregulator ArsR/SmtB family transcription factor [Conexibacter woesei]ADB53395.1 transcriptional regulator, ArsR family [Conexibacter woesei DSM 14684]
MPEPVPLDTCAVRLVDPERVAAVRARMPDDDATERLARVFHVLAEPARVRIVTALLEAGELCVCDLAAAVGQPEAATSQHLRVLRAERTVRNRRDGRMVYYSLDDAHVRMLMDLALQHVTHGSGDGGSGAEPGGS